MNLSAETMAVLKNYAEINPNIIIKAGNVLQAVSGTKTIVSEATITEKFESQFGIHDLPKLLQAIELFDKPTIKANGGDYLTITDEKSGQSIKYYYSDQSVLTKLEGSLKMPEKLESFTLKKNDFEKLLKAARTLGLSDIALKADGKTLSFMALEKKIKGSNTFLLKVGETNKTFKAYFKTDNFKFMPDDYDVAISAKKISNWISRTKPIQYWIALEPDSEF